LFTKIIEFLSNKVLTVASEAHYRQCEEEKFAFSLLVVCL